MSKQQKAASNKTLKKLEKKVEKKVMSTKSKSWASKLNDLGGKIRKGIMDSSIGFNTPLGSIGYGFKGLVINPPGSSENIGAVSTARSGKRAYYMTGTAPKVAGYTSGLRIVACQTLVLVAQKQSVTSAFNIGGGIQDSILLSPDFIGGQMALDARNYGRYRFASIALEHVSNLQVGATTSGTITSLAQNYTLAFISDAAAPTFVTSFSAISLQGVADSTVIPVWTQGGMVVKNLGLKSNLYYTEYDSTSSASVRASCQGIIMGQWNTAPGASDAAVNTVGEVIIHYVLDLYDRAPDYGFTMSVDPSVGKEALELLYLTYRDKVSRRDRLTLSRLLRPPTKEVDPLGNELDNLIREESKELSTTFVVEPPSPNPSFKDIPKGEMKEKSRRV
jgi:hypothetical protein